MANVTARSAALLLLASGALGAQESAPRCVSTRDVVTTGSIATLALAGTAGQKVGAHSSGAFRVTHPASAGALWNDSQTPLHTFVSYELTKVGAATLGRCVSPASAAWRGAAYSAAIGLAKEVADGYYTGFNSGDLAADAAGIGLAIAQAYVPRLESATLTVSLAGLGTQATTHGQRVGTAGHALWLSVAPKSLLPAAAARVWPRAVRMSLGRRVTREFDGPPEYALTMDLDAAAMLPGTGSLHGLRSALRTLHLPAPGLIVAPGQKPRVAIVF